MSSRRDFIRQGGLTAGALATATALGGSMIPGEAERQRRKEGVGSVKVTKMIIEPITIELDEPFTISLGTMTHLENVLVTLVLENGVEGYGEAAPILQLNSENQSTIISTLNSCKDFIVGQDISSYREIAYTLKSAFWAQNTARCAIEMALLDAYTKTLNIPFYKFLGGTNNRIETDFTISIVPTAQARREATELAAMGFRVIKTKVGNNHREDVDRVLAIQEGAPDCGILIDANQGYNPKAALRFINEVEKHGIYPVMFEQPVRKNDLEGMKFVRDNTSVMVGADETVFTAMDAINVVRTGCADAINIKLMKSCLIEALDIAAVARSAGLKLMIGCMVETFVGLGCAVHFAAGLGCFEYIDLDPNLNPAMKILGGGPDFTPPYWTIGNEAGMGFRK